MDITKFYPSIDHNILKFIISRKIKDTKVLEILYEIIDSVNGINGIYGKGVPIGNYLSQYFAKRIETILEGMKMMVSWMCLILEAIGLVTDSETLA